MRLFRTLGDVVLYPLAAGLWLLHWYYLWLIGLWLIILITAVAMALGEAVSWLLQY